MATGLFNWSRTAASNASATYTWAEGMAPSSVNDSARGIMSDVAQWRDDISGAIVTGGSSTAYTVTSYSTFTTLALMNGQMIAFTPHTANGATVTLNVDGLGAKPLRPSTGVELGSNVLIAGTPYVACYNNSDAVFYLFGLGGNSYGIPLGAGMDYWGATAPSTAFAFPYGQAISRTTYSALFTLFGTSYGVGDGSTTFNLPDVAGRVTAAQDGLSGSLAGRLNATGGMNGTGIGSVGGSQTRTLAANQIPAGVPSSGTNSISVLSAFTDMIRGTLANLTATTGAGQFTAGNGHGALTAGTVTSTGSNSIAVTSTNAGQAAVITVQPTITCNYILRIL
jgi:microcystin-dependent protein